MSLKHEMSEFKFEFPLNIHDYKMVEPVFMPILVEILKLTVISVLTIRSY